MSKLLTLKEWLTVKDAAKRLSISTGEKIKEADVLRLALDGHLTLSVYFVNHANGRPARIETLGIQHVSNAPSFYQYGPPNYVTIEGELLPNKKEVLIYEGEMAKPQTLEGVWDLLMLGGEKLDVENLFQAMTGGPEVRLICLGGPLVASADRTKVFQILDSYKCRTRPKKPAPPPVIPEISKDMRESLDQMNAIFDPVTVKGQEDAEPLRWDYEVEYYPADTLPPDSVFVVRVGALREFEGKLLANDNPPEKPLHTSERKSAGQIIAALSAMARLDLSNPYKADQILRASAASNGLELPSSPETVTKFLRIAAAQAGKA
jgi:hypothetical protein